MFINEPRLFSIGTISLTLDIMDAIVINIVQIQGIINILDFVVELI